MIHSVGSILLVCASSVSLQAPDLLADANAWNQSAAAGQTLKLDNGHLTIKGADFDPALFLTAADYENFDLQFEFRAYKWCASGLLIHAPHTTAYRAAIEIELSGHPSHKATPFATGAIFRRVAPLVDRKNVPAAWHTCQVHMDWPRLTVHIDDDLMQDIDLSTHPDLKHALRRGPIGFIHHSGQLEVRNLNLTPLPDSENGIVMFNGVDLDGWTQLEKPAKFTAQDGILTSSRGNGYLQFDRQCQDFDLRCYVRTSPGTNGGIFFRWTREDGGSRGTEIQIWDVIGGVMPTGSIYGTQRAKDALIRSGEWNLLQISVRGTYCETRINGEQAAVTDQLPDVRKGHIVLQMHSSGSIDYQHMVLVPKD